MIKLPWFRRTAHASAALAAGIANQTDLLNRKLDQLIAGLDNQSGLLNRKADESAAGIANQSDLLNRKLDAVIAGIDNATGVNRKLEEIVVGINNQSDLLNRKLEEIAGLLSQHAGPLNNVAAGVANQADLLNRKLEEIVLGIGNQSDLFNRKTEDGTAGIANQSDLLNRKLDEIIGLLGRDNAGGQTGAKPEKEVTVSIANQSELLNRKLEEVVAGLNNQSQLLNRKFNQLMEQLSSPAEQSGRQQQGSGFRPKDKRVLLQLGMFQGRGDPARIRSHVEQALRLRERHGYRAAVAALVEGLGVRVPLGDESYFAEAFHYYVGLISASIGDAQPAIDHLQQSNTLPGTGGPAIFEDLIRDSLAIDRLREAAAERGIPTFFVASMPRSASSTLIQTLAAMLGIPHVRISLGQYPQNLIVPRWLDAVKSGGAILHDHFGAIPPNLEALRRSGTKEVFVLIRDPRAAAVSLTKLERLEHPEIIAQAKFSEAALDLYLTAFIPWLTGWLEADRNHENGIKVHWITSAAVTSNISAVWRVIYDVLSPRYPALAAHKDAILTLVTTNSNNEVDDRPWQELVDDADRKRMWDALPKEIVTLLDLKP